MPNWSKTKYVITGSVEDISKLNSVFEKVSNNETNKSGDFDNHWLGFVVKELDGDEEDIFCRGWFESVKLKNETTLTLTTFSAWSPCFELFELITKQFSTLNYFFICAEPGNEVYLTNDKEKKYFKYGKKYSIINKEDIEQSIKIEKWLSKQFGKMPNNEIYIRV